MYKISIECGTKQAEEIFKDINISKQLNDSFKGYKEKKNLINEKFEVYFTIIHSNSWPFASCLLPPLSEPVYYIFFNLI